ncbi:hypothetical protein ACI65C_013467 [Semiaphis heraclei]
MMNDIVESDDIVTSNIVIMKPKCNLRKLTLLSTAIRNENFRPKADIEDWIIKYSAHDFHVNYRMTQDTFYNLLDFLQQVSPEFCQENFVGGNTSISVKKKMLIAQWYFGKEGSMQAISDHFNVVKSSVYNILNDFMNIIISNFKTFIHWPSRQECLVIEERFKLKGGIPGVIGAIDGTHINVKAPLKQADSYTNRKLGKSMIVQAVCTEGKIFTNISVGFPGRIHDARVMVNSELYKQVSENGPSSLFYDKYHLLGDTAYPNREWLITPFKNYGNTTRRKTKFNYLHAKTRVAIECAFGLLKERWRRLLYLNKTKIENAPKVILTCCFLHNFCLVNNDTMSAILTDFKKMQTPQVVIREDYIERQQGNFKRDQLLNLLVPPNN